MYKGSTSFIIYCMESFKCKPTEEERDVIEAVWIQYKGACEKLKEGPNIKGEYIWKLLKEMAHRYFS